MSFESQTLTELRNIAKTKGLKGYSKLRKNELIQLLTQEDGDYPRDFMILQHTGASKYTQLARLGTPGKEGTVYLVIDPDTLEKYAMKTFRKKKSGKTLEREAYFQYLASQDDISPRVIEYNPEEKYIVMDLLSRTLMDIIREQQGKLSLEQQKQIINLYKRLDSCGVMINDANPLNIMEKNGVFYAIDFGFAKPTSHRDFKNYSRPNFQLMPIGLLIWMKGRVATQSWTYIRQQIPENIREDIGINQLP